ncbi:hypothetical protein BDV96DRAFT_637077 [Lophiotrema nucula]|uniref:Uncharacterized protein n=1 Tax=Lophiotrema nucula TaxID=690887 RepID=A0A6A5YMQ7_9PLEO|nr:hypothetical protein BDV96DRAFT_637077 [Lophiotrema nucula]
MRYGYWVNTLLLVYLFLLLYSGCRDGVRRSECFNFRSRKRATTRSRNRAALSPLESIELAASREICPIAVAAISWRKQWVKSELCKVKHGPECFIRDDDSDDSEESKKRDMRDEVPLKLNRPWLRHTAEAIDIRLEILASDMDDTDEWQTMKKLVTLLGSLSNMAEDDPKLVLEEYKEIWDTFRAANAVEAEFPITLFSVAEKVEMSRIMSIGGAMYRAASCNAALLGVRGEKIEKKEGDEVEEPPRDLGALAMNIYGGLLDGKDFFGDKKWFTREEDKEMLKSINQLRTESRKRG